MPAHTTVNEARDVATRDEDLLQLAADIVADIAPPPDPEPPEYADKAARAERVVFRYLDDTDAGAVHSKALANAGSTTYATDPAVIRLVRDAFGSNDTPAGSVRVGRIV